MADVLFTLESPVGAEEHGPTNPLEVGLLSGAESSILLTDGSSVLVTEDVARDLKSMCVGAVFRPAVVWSAQPDQRHRLPDMVQVSSAHQVHLQPSLVKRRPDGTINLLRTPFRLEDQSVPEEVGVFLLAENEMVLFSEPLRDALKRHSRRLRFSKVPLASETK
jgi:hypothetical protein